MPGCCNRELEQLRCRRACRFLYARARAQALGNIDGRIVAQELCGGSERRKHVGPNIERLFDAVWIV